MILVTGGTGFVGRHLVARLVAEGEEVRVLARHPAQMPGVELVSGDVTEQSSLSGPLRGCRAVVHLVGIIRETGRSSFRRVHVEGTRNLIQACQAAGVERLLHVSALGTREHAPSRYHRSRWRAEELVRSSELPFTIFRPSVIFGQGSPFISQLKTLVAQVPVVPIVGDGTRLLQPIWVEDVATCLVRALPGVGAASAEPCPSMVGRTYELGGPETFGFEQLMDLIAEASGAIKPKVHLPVAMVKAVSAVCARLCSKFPLTLDQLTMLLEDNICEIAEMRETFQISPAPLRDHLSD